MEYNHEYRCSINDPFPPWGTIVLGYSTTVAGRVKLIRFEIEKLDYFSKRNDLNWIIVTCLYVAAMIASLLAAPLYGGIYLIVTLLIWSWLPENYNLFRKIESKKRCRTLIRAWRSELDRINVPDNHIAETRR